MADFLKVFSLGDKGVNRVRTPLHLEDDELVIAQNAVWERRGGRHALSKRPGMDAFTDVLDATGVLALGQGGLTLPPSPPGPTEDPDLRFTSLKGLFFDEVFMRCRLYLSGATTSIADNTSTELSWDTEDYDVGNMHDLVTDPPHVTVPPNGDGLYLIIAQVKWATSASGKKRGLRILKNDGIQAAVDSAADDDGDGMTQQCVALLTGTATDFFTVKVEQDTGGALDLLGGSVDETCLTVLRVVQTVDTPIPHCHAYITANVVLTQSAWTVVPYAGEAIDSHSMHDLAVNNSRITIPAGHTGMYSVMVQWSVLRVDSAIQFQILKNGSQQLAEVKTNFGAAAATVDDAAIAGDNYKGTFGGIYYMEPGDYFEVRAYTSAADQELNVDTGEPINDRLRWNSFVVVRVS